MMAYCVGFLLGLLFIIIIGRFASSHIEELTVGDICFWKPTNVKCMIFDEWCKYFYIKDLDGNRLNGGRLVHKNMLIKVKDEPLDKSPPTMQ